MAGAAITTPYRVKKFGLVWFEGPIKNAEILNHGDAGAVDSSGNIVAASKTQAAIVKAQGVVVFTDAHDGVTNRTGNAAGTVRASLALWAYITNANTTLIPSLAGAVNLYLGPVPTATVSNITGAQTTTAADHIQPIGFGVSATEALIFILPSAINYQAAATSTAVASG